MAHFQDTSSGLRVALEKSIQRIQGEEVTLRRLMEVIGEQGLLLLSALLTIPFLIPVSIPGVSTVFGAAIILISVAIITNHAPWLPRRLLDKPLDADKLRGVLKRGISIVDRIEGIIRPRLHRLTQGGFASRMNGLGLMLGGVLLMFPLGLIPFSNTLPALGILFLAVGMSQRDGAVVLLGYAMLVLTIVYFAVLAWLAFIAGRGLTSLFGG